MRDPDLDQLKQAVERQCGCTATAFQSALVKETFDGKTVWEGVVYTFSLTGHPTARRAYAWSSSADGSARQKFFALLHQWPVTSPVEAVRATMVKKQRPPSAAPRHVWGLFFCRPVVTRWHLRLSNEPDRATAQGHQCDHL